MEIFLKGLIKMKKIIVIISPIFLLLGSLLVDLICINAEMKQIFINIIVFVFYFLFCVFQFMLGNSFGSDAQEDKSQALIPIMTSGLLSLLIYLIPFSREYIMMSGYIVFQEGTAYYFIGISFVVFQILSLIIGFIIGKKKHTSAQ